MGSVGTCRVRLSCVASLDVCSDVLIASAEVKAWIAALVPGD